MSHAQLNGVAVRGLRACVPSQSRTLYDEGLFSSHEEQHRLEKSIGVTSRRVARPEMMTSDLCQHAAEGLMAQLGWERDTIDMLLFVTQTGDYVIPATACALQSLWALA